MFNDIYYSSQPQGSIQQFPRYIIIQICGIHSGLSLLYGELYLKFFLIMKFIYEYKMFYMYIATQSGRRNRHYQYQKHPTPNVYTSNQCVIQPFSQHLPSPKHNLSFCDNHSYTFMFFTISVYIPRQYIAQFCLFQALV